MLTGTSPQTAGHKPVSKRQLDVDNALVGNTSQLGVAIQAVHVVLLLRLGNSTHLIFGPTLVPQLQSTAVNGKRGQKP